MMCPYQLTPKVSRLPVNLTDASQIPWAFVNFDPIGVVPEFETKEKRQWPLYKKGKLKDPTCSLLK
jgi:hypothetical protein